MEAWIIGAIILLGLALVFLEIFFIPGTTLFGVAGGVALTTGVVLVYVYFGKELGHKILFAVSIMVVGAVILGFKIIQSNKLAMKAEISGKVNELHTTLKAGERGVTVTALRPNGKAQFSASKAEVYSLGDYIDRDTEVEISQITTEKIFVKPIKNEI